MVLLGAVRHTVRGEQRHRLMVGHPLPMGRNRDRGWWEIGDTY